MTNQQFRLEYLYPNRTDIHSLRYIGFDVCNSGFMGDEKENFEAIHITECNYAWEKLLDEKWRKENIQKGANVLANLPEYLPEYIARTSRIIMDEFLGINSFPNKACFDTNESFFKKGKLHLSVFLCVLEQLIESGINLTELPVNYSQFFFVGGHSSYDTLADDSSTPDVIRNVIVVHGDYQYNGKMGLMKQYCYYKNLEEFLKNIQQIINRVDSSSLIPNPDTLDFQENKYFLEEIYPMDSCFQDMQQLLAYQDLYSLLKRDGKQEGDLCLATSYIDKVLDKLSLGAKRAEKMITMNHVRDILNQLAKTSKPEEKKELIQSIEDILKDTGLTTVTKKEWEDILGKEEFEKFLKELDPFFEQVEMTRLQQEVQTLKKQVTEKGIHLMDKDVNDFPISEEVEVTREELLQKIAELKEALTTKDQELAELKGILYDYLDHGGKRPSISFTSISNEEIKQLLENYDSKNRSSALRKKLLMALLAISIIGNVFGAVLYFTGKRGDSIQEDTTRIEVDTTLDGNHSLDEQDSVDLNSLPNLNLDYDKNSFGMEMEESSLLKQAQDEIYLGKSVTLDNAYYYESIYDAEPMGVVSATGSTIAYFPYLYDGDSKVFLKSIRSQKELDAFIEQNLERLDEISWKAAFSKVLEGEEIHSFLENEEDLDYRNTTFFIDFEPTLTKNKTFHL